ncbi:32558_t:CDS:2 [Racocetra persica]|uniref:32558_t:CDS:1 n=1 Tax=Racocetra persica TaxID=160502 RepID=A0ACA9MYH1_9GLOM|nr:32558_t:CDS:2 [Racocetra persica]
MALAPTIGLVALTKVIVKDITTIYENAQCNQYIAKALIDRTKTAEYFLDILSRSEEHETITKIIVQEKVEIYENTKYTEYTCQILSESNPVFSERNFYLATQRFKNTLNQAKSFAEEVTKFKGIKKYWNANYARKKFDKLMKEYDDYMSDLNTTVTITNAVQHMIDMKIVIKQFENLDKYLKNNKKSTDNITIQELSCNHNQSLTVIDSEDLSDPAIIEKKISNNSVFKKLYKKNIEVACKPFKPTKGRASECTTPSDHSPSSCLGPKQDNPTESEELQSSNIEEDSSMTKTNNGYDVAQYNLGIYYLQKDQQMALKYLSLAASRGNNDAKEKLEELKS